MAQEINVMEMNLVLRMLAIIEASLSVVPMAGWKSVGSGSKVIVLWWLVDCLSHWVRE